MQPPIKWLSGALFSGAKQLGCEADHSPPSSAKVELYPHSPIPLHGIVLSQAQGQLYLCFNENNQTKKVGTCFVTICQQILCISEMKALQHVSRNNVLQFAFQSTFKFPFYTPICAQYDAI
jgi:hypothetical protein